jgi:membrane protein
VPKGVIPWTCIWPGALAATLAMGVVDAVFPLYLSQSTLRLAAGAVFVLIALVWFYALALILLAGAVINELRFEARREEAGQRTAPALKPRPARPM